MRSLKKSRIIVLSAAAMAAFSMISTVRSTSRLLSNAVPSAPSRSVATFEDRAPVLLGYPQNEYSPKFGEAFSSGQPHYESGKPERFTITPDLTAGLYLDAATGAIQGTPEQFTETEILYTVSAVNRNGISKVQIKLLPISAEKPKVKFAQTTLVLKPGDSVDLPIESLGGPYAWLQIYPENKLPKGLHYDSNSRRLVGRVEGIDGFSFESPTQVYFLRAKGFQTITESAIHISLVIPESPENQQFHGECLSIQSLMSAFQNTGNENDPLEETWLSLDGAGPRIPSPKFLAGSFSKRKWSTSTQTRRQIQRSEWIHRYGYEIEQKDCKTALIRRSSNQSWTLYAIEGYHSGQRGAIEKGLEHRVTLSKQNKDSVLPDRLEFTRVTQKPLDPRQNWKDYLVISEWIKVPALNHNLRCDDEVKSENHRVKLSRTLQLGILHSRKAGKFFADGGPAQNPAWIQYVQKIATEAPQFSCKFLE